MRCFTLFFILLAALAFAEAPPTVPQCSVQPAKATKKADLIKLAKVDHAQAEKLALAVLPDPAGAVVKESELEVEKGCLVWSFDIKMKDKAGVQEVQIDAGDGKVLVSEYESPTKEAQEKAEDKKPAPKP